MKKQNGHIDGSLVGGKTEFDVDVEIMMQRYGSLVGCEPEAGVTEEEIKQRLIEAYRAGPTCHNAKIQPHEEALAQSARVTAQELGWDERRTEAYVLDRIMARRQNDLICQRVRMLEVEPLKASIQHAQETRRNTRLGKTKLGSVPRMILEVAFAKHKGKHNWLECVTEDVVRHRGGAPVSSKKVSEELKKRGIAE